MVPDSDRDDVSNPARSFPAHLDNLENMIEFVISQASKAGLPPSKLPHLELAAEEALVNVISYAYPPDSPDSPPDRTKGRPKEVHVRCEPEDGRLLIEIRDHGAPFDSTDKPDPDLSLDIEDRNIGGLGLFFIKKAMDEVRYRRDQDQNVLTMYLKLNA